MREEVGVGPGILVVSAFFLIAEVLNGGWWEKDTGRDGHSALGTEASGRRHSRAALAGIGSASPLRTDGGRRRANDGDDEQRPEESLQHWFLLVSTYSLVIPCVFEALYSFHSLGQQELCRILWLQVAQSK